MCGRRTGPPAGQKPYGCVAQPGTPPKKKGKKGGVTLSLSAGRPVQRYDLIPKGVFRTFPDLGQSLIDHLFMVG